MLISKEQRGGETKAPPDPSDAHLVRAAQTGDLDSFGVLAGRYYRAMLAVARASCPDDHLVQDAVQEGFAKALVKLSGLKRQERFAPWLARICRNTARDMVRAKKPEFTSDDLAQLPARENPDTTVPLVRQAIARLPQPQRELIIMRYYSNLSYEEITRVSSLTKAAINGRLRRAKEKIATDLKREGITL